MKYTRIAFRSNEYFNGGQKESEGGREREVERWRGGEGEIRVALDTVIKGLIM